MPTSAKQRELEEIEGRVVARKVLGGTASEHTGIVLETSTGEHFRLQRVGGNPFGDPVTRGLVGQFVHVRGVRLGDVFRFTDVW
ncbi:MAG TPA: hypothetical protein VHL59_03430 [Thermoanaerobaculia bacterium]|nr:hypothetical protein [Thermoanaerobaculia bacterium]